jgi:hypothetical protein
LIHMINIPEEIPKSRGLKSSFDYPDRQVLERERCIGYFTS